MGLFTLLMVASSIVYALDATLESLGVIFLIAFLLSYSIPLILNCKHIRFVHFIQGAIYATYLSPTYINILTIYAIANIHDVSWGSRPSENNALLQAVERKKSILYRNFRANFLVFWLVVNAGVSAAIISLAREGDVDIIFYLGSFLLFIMLFKIVFATLFYVKAVIDRWRVRRLIKKRKSGVFNDLAKVQAENKEEVFQIYYDHDGNIKRTTTKDDPAFIGADFKTSINSQKTFRGFNLARLTQQHRIQQGIMNNFLGKLGTRTFYKEEEDDEKGSKKEEPSIDDVKQTSNDDSSLLNEPDPLMNTKIKELFRQTASNGDNKINFEAAVENLNREEEEYKTKMQKTFNAPKSNPFGGLLANIPKKEDANKTQVKAAPKAQKSSFSKSSDSSYSAEDVSRSRSNSRKDSDTGRSGSSYSSGKSKFSPNSFYKFSFGLR